MINGQKQNLLMILEGNEETELLGAMTLPQLVKSRAKKRGIKLTKKSYASLIKTVARRYENTVKKSPQILRGIVESTELLGSDEIDYMDSTELLGFTEAYLTPHKVLPMLALNIQTVEDINKYKPYLLGLISETNFLGSDEFHSMSDVELLGFFKKFFKGVGKFAKKIGKGVGKIAKGIGKGVGKGFKGITKFIGKNWKNLMIIPLALIPGGNLIVGLVDSFLSKQEETQTQVQQEPTIPQEQYIPEVSTVIPYENEFTEENNFDLSEENNFVPEYENSDYEFSNENQNFNENSDSELLGNFWKGIGKFTKNISKKVKDILQNNPTLLLTLSKMNPEDQYKYYLKLQEEISSNINKNIIDKTGAGLYKTQVIKQGAGFTGGQLFDTWAIPVIVGLGAYFLFKKNK